MARFPATAASPNLFIPSAGQATCCVRPIHRLLRTASFRFAALYVVIFAMSSLVLGEVIFVAARTNLEQQMALGVQTETTFLQNEYNQRGLTSL